MKWLVYTTDGHEVETLDKSGNVKVDSKGNPVLKKS